MALTPKWTLCMGKEFIHRLAGHTVKPLLCDVSCGGFPDSRHIVNTQLQSLIWPVCRCKQKATLESKEKAFRTLQNYCSPWQATFIVIKHIFLLCRKSPSWIFLYGDLAQDKTHRGCCEGTHRCCGAARMPPVDTGMHLLSSTTQFPTLVLEKPSVQRCAASGLFYMSSQDTSWAPLVRSAAHCHKWSSEVLSQLLHTWCCQAAARWLPLLGGASCFLGSWDVGG